MTGAAGRGLTLALGVALGALGAGILFEALDGPCTSVEASDAKPAAHDGSVTEPAPRLPLPALAPTNRPSDAAAPDATSSRIRAALIETEGSARASELLSALEAAYARGEVGEEDLVQMLFGVLLSHGNIDAALDLVERFRPTDTGSLVQIAVAFAQQGKQEHAQELIARALALEPENDWVLNQYAGVDPAGALPHFLARLALQPPPGDPNLRLEIALLYQNSGRGSDARAQIDALLREDPRNTEALQFLSNMDPAGAEQLVRGLIAESDASNDWRAFLFQIVIDQNRMDDALAMLEQGRAQGVDPDSGSFGMLAQKYLELERPDAAIAMWERAFDAEEGDPDNWTAALQEYAPEKLLTLLEARTAHGANDEFWGALGDSYWRAGRHTEALDAWREAVRLDPEDSEWPSKVAAVAAGSPPL